LYILAGGSEALATKQLHAIAAQLDPDLMNSLPASFLLNYESPCWHRQPQQQRQLRVEPATSPASDIDAHHDASAAAGSTPVAAAVALQGSDELLQAAKQLLQQQQQELQCLPYFHILGSFQSGAFSLYSMLEQHPDVAKVWRYSM
jgi:hypothetical protein